MNKAMKQGFTLIELMVVVIIVGILAAVAVPKMAANRQKAQSTEAVAVCGAIKTALSVMEIEEGATKVGNLAGDVFSTDITNQMSAADANGTYYGSDDYAFTSITDSKTFKVTVTDADTVAPTVVYEVDAGVVESSWTKVD